MFAAALRKKGCLETVAGPGKNRFPGRSGALSSYTGYPLGKSGLRTHNSLIKEILVKSRLQIILITTATALFFLPIATAQMEMQPQPFSADMQFSSTRGGTMTRDMKGKLYFSSSHIRMEMQAGPRGGSIMITDFKTQTTDILMPEQHMYMEHKADEMAGRRPGMMPNIKPLRDPSNPCAGEEGMTCKKVGVESVNGRTCDHWQITDKNGKVSNVWIDQKLHFPIKTVSEDSSLELSNIQEGEPSASLFQIPPGYTKMDMGSMMQMGRPPQQ
jgi:Domain of unknown function (DUF4412)